MAVLDRMRATPTGWVPTGTRPDCGRTCWRWIGELEVVLAHERRDETDLHPRIADLIGGRDPMAAISRTHREIAHLGRRFSRIVADLPAAGPDAEELTELRRILHALEAILRLHFAQEDEIYESVADDTPQRTGCGLTDRLRAGAAPKANRPP